MPGASTASAISPTSASSTPRRRANQENAQLTWRPYYIRLAFARLGAKGERFCQRAENSVVVNGLFVATVISG